MGVTPTVNGQVITVFSTKGGAGKSMLATSLAVELARRSDEPVCLVDADLQFGDVAVMLKLTPHHTIVDAVSVLDRMDPPLLDSLLVTHEPSGLRVMPAPLEPAFADQVGAAEMVAIVEMLRSFCSFVIVDTPAYFNDVVLGLVEVSDQVLLVAGMDIPNIKNVKIGLQTLRLLNTPMDKLLLVLNRANSQGEARRRRGGADAPAQRRLPDPQRRRASPSRSTRANRSSCTPPSRACPSRSSSSPTSSCPRKQPKRRAERVSRLAVPAHQRAAERPARPHRHNQE